MSEAHAPSHSSSAEAYARQRREGFRWLNFSPALEGQYRQSSQSVVEHQSNVALFAGLGIWLAFIAWDLVRLGPYLSQAAWSRELWLVLHVRGVVLACFVACALALQENPPKFNRRWVIAGMLYLLSLGGSVVNGLYGQLGVARDTSVLLLLVIAMFLPLGLRLKESIALATISVATVLSLGALLTHNLQEPSMIHLAFSMLVAAALGSLSAYQREYGLREQFLLRKELEWLARQDALTGLLNRRAFNEHLELALSMGRREGHQVALMMVDADHFKLYNDAYGHAEGDHALQLIAQALQSLCRRPLDHAARTGGEEMALVLYGVNDAQAQAMSEQLVQRVRSLALEHKASPTASHVTVSVGCAISLPHEEAKSLYTRADGLLYQAKRLGRNRACGA